MADTAPPSSVPASTTAEHPVGCVASATMHLRSTIGVNLESTNCRPVSCSSSSRHSAIRGLSASHPVLTWTLATVEHNYYVDRTRLRRTDGTTALAFFASSHFPAFPLVVSTFSWYVIIPSWQQQLIMCIHFDVHQHPNHTSTLFKGDVPISIFPSRVKAFDRRYGVCYQLT